MRSYCKLSQPVKPVSRYFPQRRGLHEHAISWIFKYGIISTAPSVDQINEVKMLIYKVQRIKYATMIQIIIFK